MLRVIVVMHSFGIRLFIVTCHPRPVQYRVTKLPTVHSALSSMSDLAIEDNIFSLSNYKLSMVFRWNTSWVWVWFQLFIWHLYSFSEILWFHLFVWQAEGTNTWQIVFVQYFPSSKTLLFKIKQNITNYLHLGHQRLGRSP